MADTASLRERNATFWAGAAAGWIRHADRQDEVGRPLGAPAMERLAARPAERILDVGCGCGGTTAELAAAVGETGAAVGVDIAEAMVTAARQRFPTDRYPGIQFRLADIETLDVVPGAPFDAAFSRMTLMLLADPVAGCTTIRRSLRPGGRLAATVFRDGSVNPWLSAAMLGAAPHLGPLPPLPVGDEPGPFSFADPARLMRVLTVAGFTAVTITPCDVSLDASEDADAVAEWLIEVGPAGAAYRTAPLAAQASARAGAVRLLDRFREPGVGYRLPAGLWLVTANAAGADNAPAAAPTHHHPQPRQDENR
ncbi:class I SAM-dependent methyltransferase [Micromonospora sp. LH3U1]|uniref:class I SAM-dependent methyltransferase n=1 Tax=Micromonospora sp. LH3U1 TaxID=3018339 RepID=UPI00234904D3|nr:methyltransferase domain-containing protein [Micromonospora sp. LH3U1]WCN81757.1 methyltransferase domain-containing protein [Micromonospora sp. LH3U1]